MFLQDESDEEDDKVDEDSNKITEEGSNKIAEDELQNKQLQHIKNLRKIHIINTTNDYYTILINPSNPKTLTSKTRLS